MVIIKIAEEITKGGSKSTCKDLINSKAPAQTNESSTQEL